MEIIIKKDYKKTWNPTLVKRETNGITELYQKQRNKTHIVKAKQSEDLSNPFLAKVSAKALAALLTS